MQTMSRAAGFLFRPRRGFAATLALAAIAVGAAGCGSDDGGDASRSQPAPAASQFPDPAGKSLEHVLAVADGEGPVVSPAARVLRVGENRFSFGVFSVEREPITSAEVAIYAARGGLEGRAIGPFPARIEDLATESAFRARSTAQDPDAAPVVYVTELALNQPGEWTLGALIKDGEGAYTRSLLPTPSRVGQFDPPDVGDRAPRVSTPTADEVADVSEIDTRVPPSTMHADDLADVLGRKPVVLLFATPALCQSRICGPVVDIAEQVKRDHGDGVAFIFQEIYEGNRLENGPRPQVQAYRLPSEPWLFVIDREGVIRTAVEGAFSVEELERAVERVSGPQGA